MKTLVIHTQNDGRMSINGADVGTSSSTQFGMTGDPRYVTAVLAARSGDSYGNTVMAFDVYSNSDQRDIAEMKRKGIMTEYEKKEAAFAESLKRAPVVLVRS